MAVTSGFFNSVNGDRKYNSLQMAELFDGLINDGVYETLYNRFRVTPNEGMTIQVDTGRGWFQHTWIKNDAIYLITLPASEVLFDRIDAIVIEVDHRETVRDDSIKYVKGTPSAEPVRPTLKKGEDGVYQYPLAYILVKQGAEAIDVADITNMIGTSECPFVTGVVSVMNIDMLISQWGAQWRNWYEENTKEFEESWRIWYQTNTSQFSYDFNSWFSQLKTMLDGDVAANLAGEILNLKDKIRTLVKDQAIYETIDDNDGNPIKDDSNNDIEGRIIYVIKER